MFRNQSIKHDLNSCKEHSVLLIEVGNEVLSNECLVEVVLAKPSYDMLGVAVNGAHDVDLN